MKLAAQHKGVVAQFEISTSRPSGERPLKIMPVFFQLGAVGIVELKAVAMALVMTCSPCPWLA
jgi:hypothetical protein